MSSPKSIFTHPKELDTIINNQPSLRPAERRLSTREYDALASTALPVHNDPFATAGNTQLWNGHLQKSPSSSKTSYTASTHSSASILAGRKRSIGSSELEYPNVAAHIVPEPLHKRRQLHHFPHHILDDFDLPPTNPNDSQLPSPLFFSSNATRKTPQLPPRLSSGEAGARMLSNAHAEDSNIKTVTLARGSYSGSSPLGLSNVSTRGSTDRVSVPRASPQEVCSVAQFG